MTIRRWIALPAALAVAAALHFAAWWFISGMLADGVSAWLAERRAAGWTVSSGAPERGGWPLSATLTLPRLAMEGGRPDIPAGLTWSAERVVFIVKLLSPRLLEIGIEGQQHIRFADGPELSGSADQLRVNMPMHPGAPARSATIAAVNLRAGPLPVRAGAGEMAGLTIGVLKMLLDWRPDAIEGEPALNASLVANDVALPAPDGVTAPVYALGPRINSIKLNGAIDGPVPRMPGPGARAMTWRDSGGTVQIKGLSVMWGPLNVTGTATLALDDQLQLMGTGTARLSGYSAALDLLSGHGGPISPRAATAVRAVLSLLARAPEDGGPPVAEVPLTLRDRTLSMRQIPLARLPVLVWPAP